MFSHGWVKTMHFWQEYLSGCKVIRGYTCRCVLILVMWTLVTRIVWCLLDFPTVKLLFLSLYLINMMGKLLWDCAIILLLLKLLPNFSIHQWTACSNDYRGVLTVIFYSLHSFYKLRGIFYKEDMSFLLHVFVFSAIYLYQYELMDIDFTLWCFQKLIKCQIIATKFPIHSPVFIFHPFFCRSSIPSHAAGLPAEPSRSDRSDFRERRHS